MTREYKSLPRRKPRPEPPYVREYLDVGVRVKDILSRHGISQATLYAALEEFYVPRRGRGGGRPGNRTWSTGPARRKFSEAVKDAVVEDYTNSTLTTREIRSKYHLAHSRNLQRILDERGVPSRRETGWYSGENHKAWRGGWRSRGAYNSLRIHPDDPMFSMTNKSGYVLEHRLVMARHVGRPLTDSETVHHIDGNRQRNTIDNLELRQGAHGKGVRYVCVDCGSSNVQATTLSSKAEAGLAEG